MKSNLQHKLLLALSKSKKDKGFTLIELLVVIIIIGVLSAVALPNLLGQVGKARESEAANAVGAVNRGQQAYFTENREFLSDNNVDDIRDDLGVGVSDLEFYELDIPSEGVVTATNSERDTDNTRDHAGGVQYYSTDREFSTIVCRAEDASTEIEDSDVENAGVTDSDDALDCSSDASEVN